MSCDKTDSLGKVYDHAYTVGVWCPFDHKDVLRTGGDSVFLFTEEHGNVAMYTLMITTNNNYYNATYYEADPLNALYNVIGDIPGPKMFFEGVAFRVDAVNLKEIEKKLDELFSETGPASYVEMLDGWSFIVTRKGKTIVINDGPMIDKWKGFATFLQDSVMSPIKDLKEKGRLEGGVNRQAN
jgi:hypothetical protein